MINAANCCSTPPHDVPRGTVVSVLPESSHGPGAIEICAAARCRVLSKDLDDDGHTVVVIAVENPEQGQPRYQVRHGRARPLVRTPDAGQWLMEISSSDPFAIVPAIDSRMHR